MMHMSENGATLPLLKTVFESILEVFILCFAGWILAIRGLLDKKTQKKLNILNINLFTPALLFSKVAFFLTPSKLKELWVIPFIFVVVTLTSMIVSWGLSKACKLKRSQRAFAIAAAMFMNSNSLPIALMQSLVVTVHGLKWGKDDTRDSMLGRALTYLVLHSTFGMMLRWSYGVRLLAQADDEIEPASSSAEAGEEQSQEAQARSSDERAPLLSSSRYLDYSSTTLRSQVSIGADDDEGTSRPGTPRLPAAPKKGRDNATNTVTEAFQGDSLGLPPQFGKPPMRPPMVNRQSHFFYSFPNTPAMSHVSLAPSRDMHSPPPPLPLLEPVAQAPVALVNRAKAWSSSTLASAKPQLSKFWKAFNEFMTPPLYSALISLVVACIPPVQHALDVHMLPVKGAISMAGSCSIPITLIVLGGYFWRGDSDDGTPETVQGRLKTDLPQQRITAVPGLRRRKTHGGEVGNGACAGSTEDHTTAGDRGLSRPVSDATLVGSSSATNTWSRAWRGLRNRTKVTSNSDDHGVDARMESGGLTDEPASLAPPVTAKKGDHRGEARTVLVAILSRMIITPLIILPIMALVMTQTTMRLFDE
ncbi:hypothetical protein FRC19_005353 [Serendipita sp. 401]|nr:hypothetical protein FRC19_005353 [Serendipita sp. 401]KAG9054547.1 hypothetical protein FS842_004819 [Serendipita sp. 407]